MTIIVFFCSLICVLIILLLLKGGWTLNRRCDGNLVIFDEPEEGTQMFLEIATESDIQKLQKQTVAKFKIINKGRGGLA